MQKKECREITSEDEIRPTPVVLDHETGVEAEAEVELGTETEKEPGVEAGADLVEGLQNVAEE